MIRYGFFLLIQIYYKSNANSGYFSQNLSQLKLHILCVLYVKNILIFKQ